MPAATCHIDGFGPLTLLAPASVAEIGDVVRNAVAERQAIYPFGGQTQLELGQTPSRPGCAVDLRGLNQVIDFPARDMTITVRAGITLAALEAILQPENLRLPIDVPRADQATLGGVIATNASGPRRLGFGTLRDYVIGISAVNDEGKEFKAGGRVVKNVAGYDICKLLVGALGTLGVITQVTLKLRPRPEECALVTLGAETAALAGLLDRLHASRTRPVCLELINQTAAKAVFVEAGMAGPATPWTMVVGYEGNVDAVNWQVQQLVRELGPATPLEARVGFTAAPLWTALIEWPAWPNAHATLKASVLPSRLADFCTTVDSQWQVKAHAGNGIVTIHVPEGVSQAVLETTVKAWRETARRTGGAVIVTRCPPAWKRPLGVWGPEARDASLMRAVKQQLDPRGLFNPGRFVADI